MKRGMDEQFNLIKSMNAITYPCPYPRETMQVRWAPWNNPAIPVIAIPVHFHDKLRLRFKLILSA